MDTEKRRKIHGEGSYNLRISNINEIEIGDFQNPWTFHTLFMSSDEELFGWLRDKKLLISEVRCTQCNNVCKLYKRQRRKDGFSFRCNKHSNVELGIRKYSFFQGSAYNIRDLVIFVKYYLEGNSLLQCALSTGMDYRHTAVDWASFIREMFCQYTFDTYNFTQFQGDVEIDESLFGRKIKYNRGEPKGHRIWIFGIIHRESNKLIIYPVDNRDANTLIPLIQRHVSVGSRIFSDSWAAYMGLNDLGYEHFTVCHKTTFKQTYKNIETEEIIHCQTNQIEGAWKHCKAHFRKINGTNVKMFEQHLAEIVWRNHTQGKNKYVAFFDLVREIYTLDMAPTYTYSKPLFDTWTPPSPVVEKEHNITIMQCSSDSEADSDSQPQSISRTSSTPPCSVPVDKSASIHQTPSDVRSSVTSSPQPSTSKAIDDRHVTTRKKRNSKKTSEMQLPVNVVSSDSDTWEEDTSKKLFHPKSFRPVKKASKRKKPGKKPANIYTKSAYQYQFSSTDSDFV